MTRPTGDAAAVVRLDRVAAHVVCVTLDRPAVRNAVNAAITAGLEAAVVATEDDPTVCAVVLTGSGAAFCAGADLKVAAAGGLDSLSTPTGGFAGFVHRPRRKPWIAAVNGAAHAGGLEIALVCDIILASENASFALPEVRRGLIAAAGGLHRLARRLPASLARQMIVTGLPIDAARAKAAGLVGDVFPADRLMAEAFAVAAQIAAAAPLAVCESLAIARLATAGGEAALRSLTVEARARVLASADAREGVAAFVEKRQPSWSGC